MYVLVATATAESDGCFVVGEEGEEKIIYPGSVSGAGVKSERVVPRDKWEGENGHAHATDLLGVKIRSFYRPLTSPNPKNALGEWALGPPQ